MQLSKHYVLNTIDRLGLKVSDTSPTDHLTIGIHGDEFFKRVAWDGSLGLGEAYVDKLWSATHIDQLLTKILSQRVPRMGLSEGWLWMNSKFINQQSMMRSLRVAKQHYNVDTDVFEHMLDPYLQYTCGYWKEADTLEQAQINKMGLVIRKLKLKAGDRLLDVGCGWGGFAKFAAERYGIEVVGVSISESQLAYARKLCAGLTVEFLECDYRTMHETLGEHQFDGVSIIGMTEHIGPKNYKTLYKCLSRQLKPNGLLLQHTIGRMESKHITEPFIDKYIFPGGVVPSVSQLSGAMEGHFVLEDLHNFGADYDKTLMAWHQRISEAEDWVLQQPHLGERFFRTWEYYLLSCAALFRTRRAQLFQLVLSPNGQDNGYLRVS